MSDTPNNIATVECEQCEEKVPFDDHNLTIILYDGYEDGRDHYKVCGDCFDYLGGSGKIVKCPKCKEWIDSLSVKCANCGKKI